MNVKMNPTLEAQIHKWTAEGVLHGWCPFTKAMAMANLILETDAQLVVELGVFGGRSLVPQAAACAHKGSGFCFGIDAWSVPAALESLDPEDLDDREHIKWWSALDMNGIYWACARAIDQGHLFPYCALVQGRGEHLAALFPDPPRIDILHIDGNHTVQASCRDVGRWLPRVRPGGHIWFDDSAWESTKPAQVLLGNECDLLDDKVEGGSSWRLYRKRAA